MTRVVAGATQAPGPHDDTGAPALTSTPRRNVAARQLYAIVAGNTGGAVWLTRSLSPLSSAPSGACGRRCIWRTVACGSSPAGNPRRRQYIASREPVIVCQKVATAQGAAKAALRYCRGRVDPAGYLQVMQVRRAAAWLCR